ncbi:dihydroorotate dehydrogenase (quinone) [Candidatus Nanosynbacter lyticus]|uniref:dihydroorotate dehydrogenase (quinone) n=1 Tax=Candidatus Nanosynbacter lyticus TaxID=2093824 RepID=UPI00255398D9|nr:dihydroorotate dehydrogenase (quinone) [Candidatus Nanosynbacter lyticus]WLD46539.1 dihydroorotate dehydrogenase (quinone) [Candidatus Nanosynbacter lyticus]
MYKYVIKPLLFLLTPDFTHKLIVFCGRVAQALPPVRWGIRKSWGFQDNSLQQEVSGITFRNPIGLSAGFDKNIQLLSLMEDIGFGFASGGSVTLEPRKGNRRPWFHRLPKTKSVVVFAGMPNKGLRKIRSYIERNTRRSSNAVSVISVAVIANKTTIEQAGGYPAEQAIINDVKKATEYIIHNKLASVVEINISCPNAGKEPFIEAESLDVLLTTLDIVPRDVPFWVKMPHLYDVEQFDSLLKVIVQHNVQGVTVANLIKDRSKINIKDSLTDEIRGGLSGAPTREHSLELIRHAYKKYGDRLTIIGVGGVFSAEDAYAKIKAGASLVGLITGLFFEGPQLVGQINRGLVELLKKDGFSRISEAVGADFRSRSKKTKKL